jgi:LemA protein
MFIVLLILTALVVFWFVGAYNSLISLKNQVANAWKQIDVQLKRRHDLVPNLIAAVKGAMNFERQTLEAVVSARNQAIQVSSGGDVSKIAASEGQLTGALHRLLAVVESYPDLKATGNIGQLQEELTSTENKIAFARQLYNDVATQYNTKQKQVPTVFVAGMAGAVPAHFGRSPKKRNARFPKWNSELVTGDW